MTLAHEWEPGTWYGAGSVVVYRGVRYKIIQPHTSEPGWEPPATPALWGRMQEEYGYAEEGDYGRGFQRGQDYSEGYGSRRNDDDDDDDYRRGEDYSEGYGSQGYGESPRGQGFGAVPQQSSGRGPIYAGVQQPTFQGGSRGIAYENDAEASPASNFSEGYNPSYIKPGQLPQATAIPGQPHPSYGGPGQSVSFQAPSGPPPSQARLGQPAQSPAFQPPPGPPAQTGYGADRGYSDQGYDNSYGGGAGPVDQGYDKGYGGNPVAPVNQGYDKGYGGPPTVIPAPAPVPPSVPAAEEKAWDQHQEQQVEIHHDERKKSWYDLDPKRKKQLEIGGGLALGAAALAAGYYAFHSHQKTEEEKKAQVWALQNWLQEAEARTQAYYNNGPTGPATWILAEGGNVPEDAIPGGEQHGEPLFICRGYHEGGLQIGKVSPGLVKGGIIGFGFKEIEIPKYEVLVGDPRALRWVDARGRLNPMQLGARPVEGGREADGTPLFVAKVHHHHNAVIPGKVGERLDGAVVPINNTEEVFEEYRVLCYA